MKISLLAILMICLSAPLGLAQVNGKRPADSNPLQPVTAGAGDSRDLGDLNWYLDTESLTGDMNLQGVCYAETSSTESIWCTGASDFTIAYIYEIDAATHTLLKTVPQPVTNWGTIGWADLCFDGNWLYAGDPNAGFIEQISPLTGTVTGVIYGPFPLPQCKALAYDPVNDCFWTANGTSSIYQCFRNSTFNVFSGQGLTHFGAGMEEKNNMVWWWSQDGGTGAQASEYDPATQTLTGKAFNPTTPLGGGIAGGAGGRFLGFGMWELIGMFQGGPDHIGAFDLDTRSLRPDVDQISEATGGIVNFTLDAGPAYAGRTYLLLGGVTGTSPGTPLPGGGVTLPLNWDVFTGLVITLLNTPIFNNFFGALDGSGTAAAKFDTLGPIPGTAGMTLYFAYALMPPPAWDFASNAVSIAIVP